MTASTFDQRPHAIQLRVNPRRSADTHRDEHIEHRFSHPSHRPTRPPVKVCAAYEFSNRPSSLRATGRPFTFYGNPYPETIFVQRGQQHHAWCFEIPQWSQAAQRVIN